MTLSRWVSTFGEDLETAIMTEATKQELDSLKAELEILKRELEQERLRRQAYQVMIKIAEEEYKIPIEKKYGVKRSKR